MKWKKNIILFIIIVILIGLCIILLKYKNIISIMNQKRYDEIRMDIKEEATEYLKISHPYCSPGSGDFTIKEESLLYQWGMDKETLLDIDKESYCKVRVEATCVSVNKLDLDVYLSCKDYEDENYSNWEYRD